ncbi:MAG TPA: hypothetical protein ENI23_12910 [bacterium]|nr:hypothetical protein [bacterium]
MSKLISCIPNVPELGEAVDHLPTFKKAQQAIDYFTKMKNNSQTNNVRNGKPTLSINFYNMSDTELKKYVNWLNKNLCPTQEKLSYRTAKLSKELALLKEEWYKRYGKTKD